MSGTRDRTLREMIETILKRLKRLERKVNALLAPDGSVTPYRTAAGRRTTGALANGAGDNYPITFPAGRFTVPPIVQVTAGSSRMNVSVGAGTITTAGATIRVDNRSGGALGADDVGWTAVQMTPTTAGG